MKRWTMKELEEKSDDEVLIGILSDRIFGLTNRYSPLARRLMSIREKMEKAYFAKFNKKAGE